MASKCRHGKSRHGVVGASLACATLAVDPDTSSPTKEVNSSVNSMGFVVLLTVKEEDSLVLGVYVDVAGLVLAGLES